MHLFYWKQKQGRSPANKDNENKTEICMKKSVQEKEPGQGNASRFLWSFDLAPDVAQINAIKVYKISFEARAGIEPASTKESPFAERYFKPGLFSITC